MPHLLLNNVDNAPPTRLDIVPGGWPSGWKGTVLLAKRWASQVESSDCEDESPFCLVDIDVIFIQWRTWQAMLPRIEPLYPVHTQLDATLVQLLAALGCGFSCSSSADLRHVTGLGVPVDKIVMSSPCKTRSTVRTAADLGVPMTITDCVDDLQRLARYWPGAKVLLGIQVSDPESQPLRLKFGAEHIDWASLGQMARSLGIHLVGVSFYAEFPTTNGWSHAVATAAQAFKVLQSEQGGAHRHLTVLHIGGGFPPQCTTGGKRPQLAELNSDDISQPANFQAVCSTLRVSLERHFPSEEVRILAEPLGFFSLSSLHLVNKVMNKRTRIDPLTQETAFTYHLSGGLPSDNQPLCKPVQLRGGDTTGKSFICSMCGDDDDLVVARTRLPELQVGDYLLWPNTGDCSTCEDRHYFLSEHTVPALRQALRPQLDDSAYSCAVRRLRLRTGSGSEGMCTDSGQTSNATAAAD